MTTGFLASAALVAGGYTAPFAVLALIVPYAILALRRRGGAVKWVTIGLAFTAVCMIACTLLLRLWELGALRFTPR